MILSMIEFGGFQNYIERPILPTSRKERPSRIVWQVCGFGSDLLKRYISDNAYGAVWSAEYIDRWCYFPYKYSHNFNFPFTIQILNEWIVFLLAFLPIGIIAVNWGNCVTDLFTELEYLQNVRNQNHITSRIWDRLRGVFFVWGGGCPYGRF